MTQRPPGNQYRYPPHILGAVILFAALCVGVQTARAETEPLHDGFGLKDAFNTGSYATIGSAVVDMPGGPATATVARAQSFTVPRDQDYYLQTIELAVTAVEHAQELEIRLLGHYYGTTSMGAPDEARVLESFSLKVLPEQERAGPPGPASIILLSSSYGPVLRGGSRYWLAISVKQSDVPAAARWWNAYPGTEPADAVAAERINRGRWNVANGAGQSQAFRINATRTPLTASRAYVFSKIADTFGPFKSFASDGRLGVTNSGKVAFWAQLDTGREGIFFGSAGNLVAIGDTRGRLPEIARAADYPAVSSTGSVTWLGKLVNGSNHILLGSVDTFTSLVDDTGPLHELGHPSINSGGTVVFLAGLNGQGGGVFTLRGGALTAIGHTSGPYSGFHENPVINDKGTVAFIASLDDGTTGVFAHRGTSVTTIVDTRSTFTSFQAPALNDRGTVAFIGCVNAQREACSDEPGATQGVYKGDGGPLQTVAETHGPYRAFTGLALNNSGTAVFQAELDSGLTGIFTGPTPRTDAVIRTGDLLEGSEVEELGRLHHLGINDAGQIAFYARLRDGRAGIYLATPQSGT